MRSLKMESSERTYCCSEETPARKTLTTPPTGWSCWGPPVGGEVPRQAIQLLQIRVPRKGLGLQPDVLDRLRSGRGTDTDARKTGVEENHHVSLHQPSRRSGRVLISQIDVATSAESGSQAHIPKCFSHSYASDLTDTSARRIRLSDRMPYPP